MQTAVSTFGFYMGAAVCLGLSPVLTSASLFCSGVSEKGSEFKVEARFHPNSTEHFEITGGQAHFELDGGDDEIVEMEGHFIIPRGVVHIVTSRKDEDTAYKVRGDHDPVAERDFLM